MRKSLVVAGALLILGSLLPASGAHWGYTNDTGDCGTSDTYDDDDLPTHLRPNAQTCNVAGTVVGAAGPAVVDASGNDVVAGGLIFCDMEKTGPGDQWVPTDEAEVDEHTNPSAVAPPDGTFDDGGIGGACHVCGHLNDDFNTCGCSGSARASIDKLGQPGTGAYVAITCDAGTMSHGGVLGSGLVPGPDAVLSAGGCAGNEVRDGLSDGEFAHCFDPLTDLSGGWANCQNDGSADNSTTGYAGPSYGPANPGATCSTSDPDGKAAAIFVFWPAVDARGFVGSPTTHVWGT